MFASCNFGEALSRARASRAPRPLPVGEVSGCERFPLRDAPLGYPLLLLPTILAITPGLPLRQLLRLRRQRAHGRRRRLLARLLLVLLRDVLLRTAADRDDLVARVEVHDADALRGAAD